MLIATTGVLRKPVIILDGFDPGNTRDAKNIYKKYLTFKNSSGLNENLVQDLNAKGYDIIILNFPRYPIGSFTIPFLPGVNIPIYQDGGADYIERNAFVLVKLIDSVNAKLQVNGSTEKLVIVGPSMGGLISRYALAYMQQHSMSTNTRLWVSFDAPHNGANIPIADQWYLDFYSKNGSASAKKALNEQINSPAAKEMLIHHYLSRSETPAGAPGFKDRFVQAMNTIGFPGIPGDPNLRRIAIINGSQNGNGQIAEGFSRNINPCEKAFTCEIKAGKVIRFLLLFLAPVTISTSKPYFSPANSNRCLSFEASFPINKGRNYYARAYNSGNGLDESPGGYFDTQQQIDDLGTDTKFFSLLQVKFYSVIPNHNFIPAKSALAFTGSNQDLGENLSNRNLSCTGETPFQAYFAPSQNEPHITLTQANVNFLMNELDGNITPPPTVNTPTITASSSAICDGVNTTFSIPDQGPSTIYNWTISPTSGITIVSGQGTHLISVTSINGYTGNANINLVATTPCLRIVPPAYSIRVGGYSSSDYPVYGSSSACSYQTVSYHTNQLDGATNYQWFWPSGWTYQYGQGTYSITLTTGSSGGMVGVRVANACDAGGSPGTEYVNINCFAPSYTVSPNPARNTITITANGQSTKIVKGHLSTSGKQSINGIRSVKIYDAAGMLRKQQSFSTKTNEVQIDISNLSSGIYIVEIYDGIHTEQQKLVIQ